MKFLLLALLGLCLLSKVWPLALLVLFYPFFKNAGSSNAKTHHHKVADYKWRPRGARWK